MRLVLWDIDGTLVDSVKLGLLRVRGRVRARDGQAACRAGPVRGPHRLRDRGRPARALRDRAARRPAGAVRARARARHGPARGRAARPRASVSGSARVPRAARPRARRRAVAADREHRGQRPGEAGGVRARHPRRPGASARMGPITIAAAGWSASRCRSASASTARSWLRATSCWSATRLSTWRRRARAAPAPWPWRPAPSVHPSWPPPAPTPCSRTCETPRRWSRPSSRTDHSLNPGRGWADQ